MEPHVGATPGFSGGGRGRNPTPETERERAISHERSLEDFFFMNLFSGALSVAVEGNSQPLATSSVYYCCRRCCRFSAGRCLVCCHRPIISARPCPCSRCCVSVGGFCLKCC
ncbi:unnamed protein product [Spirodela intermedia]|uniref:Uncharacterized protein n=1 Tax=Spirodela intermedia TaxID=51605 RepID=A0A7I8IYW5_SPIIN|nr:unnamed protein product [Spirodela intermedia]CAA6663068.1 unnamed protein product [Spirodela intermedia]